tara:strand:- start:266 stop:655 length:390 start_codon:yes stop_codon:yes gene_type:complete
MSRIPEVKPSKYNKDKSFAWVDSQWEKFLKEQKELKDNISKMENQLSFIFDTIKNTPNDMELGGKLREYYWSVISENLQTASGRSDEWRIEQFNRNRAPEDWVHTIEEMDEKVDKLFNKKGEQGELFDE